MKRGSLLVLTLILVSTSIAPAVAGSRPWDRLAVRLGGFAVSFDTILRVDSETLGTGTEIDLENDTNLDRDKTESRLDGHFRFGRRHRIDYGAVLFRRSAFTTIDRQIQFGDTVFDVNAEVSTEFRNDVLKLAYRYDVLNRPAWDLGLNLRTGGEFFDVRMSNQKGSLTDVRAAIDWYPFEHFGFGVGFNRTRLGYEDLGIPQVDVTYTYSGTNLYLSYVR